MLQWMEKWWVTLPPSLFEPRRTSRLLTLREALAQFFSDDHTLRDRRKQSTGLDEPSASKRCSSTPVHWKPHFSRMLRDIGLQTRARPCTSPRSNVSKK